MKRIAIPFAVALAAACSPSADTDQDAIATPEPTVESSPTVPAGTTDAGVNTEYLTLEGLGGLTIGQPVPAGNSFAERGAQIEGPCHTVSSPDYPNVYGITIDGEVRRISVSAGSDVTLEEGIGPGSTLAEVREAFPGFREEPHKYWGPEGKYLTQPGNDPRLRFEINPDGEVATMHVGVMPQLAYVEGCA